MKKNEKNARKGNDEYLPGYPEYPENEDIYNKEEEEGEIDPENPEEHKKKGRKYRKANEKDFEDIKTGRDLDVPGSGSDEDGEGDGLEDEENDYYSLGGEDHDDLEDDRGDWINRILSVLR